MKFFAIGEDKSLKDVTDIVLALAGGAMTGNIKYKGSLSTTEIIRFLDNDQTTYGNGISIGGGGTTIIGGGEAATLLEPAPGGADPEKLILANDQGIDFYVNCQQGLDKAVHVTLNNAGLLSGHQKAIKSGTAAPSGGSNGDIYIQY